MENQYTRTVAVLGDDAIKKLNNSHVAVFGVGGVGSLLSRHWLVQVWVLLTL